MSRLPAPNHKRFEDATTEKLIAEISAPPPASTKPATEIPSNPFESLNFTPSEEGEEPGIIIVPKRFRVEGLKQTDLKKIDQIIDEIKDSLEIYKDSGEVIKVTVLDGESAIALKADLFALRRAYLPRLEIRAKNDAIAVFNQN